MLVPGSEETGVLAGRTDFVVSFVNLEDGIELINAPYLGNHGWLLLRLLNHYPSPRVVNPEDLLWKVL